MASSVVDNRIVRFTASGDTALAGSETLIRSLPLFPNSCFHNSGNIHFGLDDTLLVTYGDGNFPPFPSLDLSDLHGKMLRLDATTGQAAPGNFFATDGDSLTLPEIWAYGLRNSFDFTCNFLRYHSDEQCGGVNARGGSYGIQVLYSWDRPMRPQ